MTEIHHVSDTALWVAAFRAIETQRTNALFQDPFAELLTGDRGKKIARAMPFYKRMEIGIAMRTHVIDEYIDLAIGKYEVDTILNLGAGLDTRPFRMDLPKTLCWYEIDFPSMIEYKRQKMADHNPRCHFTSIPLDLGNHSERRACLQKINSTSKRVLVLSEGLIYYLTQEQVDTLSKDLLEQPNFHFWIQDYFSISSNPVGQWVRNQLQKKLIHAPFQFLPENWIDYFAQRGWKTADHRTLNEELFRLSQLRKLSGRGLSLEMYQLFRNHIPSIIRKSLQQTGGYVLFQKNVT